jgi:hypothetical protein
MYKGLRFHYKIALEIHLPPALIICQKSRNGKICDTLLCTGTDVDKGSF